MSLSSAKAKLDAQAGDPATGYISKQDHKDSYDELIDDTTLTGTTTAEDLTVNGRDVDNLVAGPGSATDNALVRFDGTGGKTVQNSGIVVDDSNNVSGIATLSATALSTALATTTYAAQQTVSAQTDSYTLVTADAGKLVTVNKATAATVTVNGSLDLAVGQRIDIVQLGAGQVTVSASSATVNGTPGLKLRAQYSACSLVCLSTDTYLLVGDLSA